MTDAVPLERARSLRSETAPRASRLAQRLFLLPAVRWWCRPLVVRGAPPADGPVVFVANHASHADTAVLLAALHRGVRARTAPAAAADYFFRGRVRAGIVRALVGAFPFPRRGTEGLARASRMLDSGRNVLLFPEGTRSTDGRIGKFKPGVGVLAAAGATIVPVAIAGTREVLPKGARWPRRAPVVVAFGERIRMPGVDPVTGLAAVERAVRRLTVAAERARPLARRTLYESARAFAHTPRALWLLLAWGFAEALAWPIVPDFPLVLLAVAAPARVPLFALAALGGSLAGGALAYGVGALAGSGVLAHVPLVAPRMVGRVGEWYAAEGAEALRHQPWSGVPFKVFGYRAAEAGVGLGGFLTHAAWARGLRFLEVGAIFAVSGAAGRRVAPRLYAAFAGAFTMVFLIGLARVAGSWS